MRQSAKWALVGLGLLALSAIAVAVVLVLVIAGARVPGNAVLVVKATGSLPDHDNRSPLEQVLGGEIITLPDIVDSIGRAANDPRIRGIELRVGSLETGLAKTQELRAALAAFRASGKPILGYMEVGGNREYYVASVADELYLMPGGMLMTTGLLADAPFFKGTLDKLKIEPELEHIGEYKSASETWTRESMSEAQRRATDSILDSLFGQIVNDIAASRKLTVQKVREGIDAGLLTPEEAKERGFVDGLLYEDQVKDKLEGRFGHYSELRVRTYKGTGGFRRFGHPRIAVINAAGTIVSGRSGSGSFGGEFIGSGSLTQILKDVREDDGIRAVVLRVDSPGGSGIASDAIWRETVLLKEQKPFVVSMADVAASGGYYISMGADAIVAEPATITGSIGVITGKFNMKGFYESWLGMHRDQIKRGENADLFSDYSGFSDQQRGLIRRQMEVFYRDFVHKAAEGRSKKDEEIDKIGQGRIWSGEQAKQLGLVDELGGLDTAIAIAKEKAKIPAGERVSIESYPKRRSLLQSLSGDEDDEASIRRTSLPARLGRVLSEIEIRERISAEGPAFYAGDF